MPQYSARALQRKAGWTTGDFACEPLTAANSAAPEAHGVGAGADCSHVRRAANCGLWWHSGRFDIEAEPNFPFLLTVAEQQTAFPVGVGNEPAAQRRGQRRYGGRR